MIIPIKCFTCGMVIANKYRYYLRKVKQRKLEMGQNVEKVVYLTKSGANKTIEGQILDEIGIHHACCRRHMLTHVDIY
jgi:DNA-directed RNA polymerase subunit N (RpoN/RPB10)